MRRTRFDDSPCPIARTADLIGDWWTPMVLREAFLGRRRETPVADTEIVATYRGNNDYYFRPKPD